jgi:pimeloyl-ACP methyl ester carboxylesterase
MPKLEHDDVSIRYEDTGAGTGFPVLLLSPGAMDATVEAWARAAYNPLTALDGAYRLISMDHRNAGQSVGPLDPDDPWGTQVRDQIDILDRLGIDRVHVIGCCIGASYALKMAEMVPDRAHRQAGRHRPRGGRALRRQHVGRRRVRGQRVP